MSKPQIKPMNLPAILWSQNNIYTLNEENYKEIIDWWDSLAQKTVAWDVFSGVEKKPIFRDILVIESSFVDNFIFCWRKQGFNHWNTLNPQHLALDYSHEKLSIIPTSKNWFLYNYKIKILY